MLSSEDPLLHDVADNALVAQVRAGEYQAFEELVSRHERRLYALAWHLTHNHHDAEDVVQNAFLSAMEHLADFRAESAFSTWITRIAINHALKLLRTKRQHSAVTLEQLDDDGEPLPLPEYIAKWRDDPVLNVERNELRAILDEAIERLTPGQRLVFVLRDIQGLSGKETADILNVTENSMKVRLLRARLALRETLTRRFGDPASRQAPHDHEREHPATPPALPVKEETP